MIKHLQKSWGNIGTALFWLLWPFWVLYFKMSNRRSRVLVVHNNTVLLVQNWIGSKHYSLPGGGARKRESATSAGVRELQEETGITLPVSALTETGSLCYNKRFISYEATFFSAELNLLPLLKIRKLEISKAIWMPLAEYTNYPLDDETLYALKRYKPLEQASLL